MHDSSDTSHDALGLLIEGYRRMSGAEKIRRVLELNRALEQLAEARIRSQYGHDLSEQELALRLGALRLDRRTMIEVYDWDPEVRGY